MVRMLYLMFVGLTGWMALLVPGIGDITGDSAMPGTRAMVTARAGDRAGRPEIQ